MHFSEKSCPPSTADPEILVFASHCSANFQLILNCFTSNFKLMYEDSENIKADHVNTVVFNLRQIKRRAFILGYPVLTEQNDQKSNLKNFRIQDRIPKWNYPVKIIISITFPRERSTVDPRY